MTTLHPDHRPTRLSLDRPIGPDPAAAGVHVLHVHGALDRAGGARLLRLADAQLALVRTGTREITHLVVDLSGATGTGPGGAAALRHLRFACERLGIGVHLAGADALASAGIRPAERLTGFDRYPTVDVALAALTVPPARSGGLTWGRVPTVSGLAWSHDRRRGHRPHRVARRPAAPGG